MRYLLLLLLLTGCTITVKPKEYVITVEKCNGQILELNVKAGEVKEPLIILRDGVRITMREK